MSWPSPRAVSVIVFTPSFSALSGTVSVCVRWVLPSKSISPTSVPLTATPTAWPLALPSAELVTPWSVTSICAWVAVRSTFIVASARSVGVDEMTGPNQFSVSPLTE